MCSGLARNLHGDEEALVTGVEVEEAADQPHAVELPGFLLEAADEEHPPIGVKLLLLVEFRHFRGSFGGSPARGGALSRWFAAGNGHLSPRVRAFSSVRRPVPQ